MILARSRLTKEEYCLKLGAYNEILNAPGGRNNEDCVPHEQNCYASQKLESEKKLLSSFVQVRMKTNGTEYTRPRKGYFCFGV